MPIKFYLIFLSLNFLFFIKNGNTQSGCTDPQAVNYDPGAAENNGSCLYATTTYSPICLEKMPDEIPECSGLQYFDGQLWAHNDSGDGPQFYQIDTTNGSVLHTVWIENAAHVDWEDITESEEYIYLGDFGNNSGSRQNLKVLRIKKSDLSEDTVSAEEINFSYADQADFTPMNRENDYDCEAFFYKNDSLWLFSKNWVDNKTRLYVLPDELGNHSLEPRAEFDAKGLITGADISTDGKNITLLGYTENATVFMWLLFDYQDFMPFSGNKRQIKLGTALTRGQAEAITFQNEDSGFIGSENISFVDGKLMHFKITPWISNFDTNVPRLPDNSFLHAYPNPFVDELLIDVKSGNQKVKKVEIFDRLGRRILKKRNGLKNRIRIDGNRLSAGMYVMKITLKGGGVMIEKIVKQ